MFFFKNLKSRIFWWNKHKQKFLKFKFFKAMISFIKPFFKQNLFTKLNIIFWPVRNSLNEFFWTKSIWPVKNKISGFFLRKNKIFYKGRYARNRQTCRVIVFWTIALNLFCLYGLYFFFYQFTFNFGYFWWGLFFLYISLTWSNILKNKFYNPINIILEIFYFFRWYFLVLKNFF